MKIKFESDDDLPLTIITINSVFEKDSKYYPQVLLRDCFYEHEEGINPLVVN